jgi:spermidine synthase
VGRLYVLNTAGGIIGSLLAGFLLLPALGVWRSLIGAGLMSVVVGVALSLLASDRLKRARWAYPIGIAAGALVLVAAAPDLNLSLFNQGPYREVYRGGKRPSEGEGAEQLIYQREGINTAVAVFRFYGSATLYVGGKPDASTNPGDLPTQLFLGHLHPLQQASARRRGSGYGAGRQWGQFSPMTTWACGRGNRAGGDRRLTVFRVHQREAVRGPRSRLVLEDGRVHLAYTDTIYDVITRNLRILDGGDIESLTADFYREVGAGCPRRDFCAVDSVMTFRRMSFRRSWISSRDLPMVIFQPIPGDFIVRRPSGRSRFHGRVREPIRPRQVAASFRAST